MAELQLVEDRLISGTGVLRIPEAVLKGRLWIIYFDVIRRPSQEYQDFKWTPPQSLYARICYRRDGYVSAYDHIRFLREERTTIADITGQNLRAIKCAFNATIASLADIGTALNIPITIAPSPIESFESLSFTYNEVTLQCYADTALQVRLFKLKYDVCKEDDDKTKRPPPPPPPLPPVPPRTPIGDISPPYDEDDDLTQPYEGDDVPPPEPETRPCIAYNVVVRIYANWGDPDGGTGNNRYVDRNADVWGEVFGLDFRKGIGAYVAIVCQGSTTTECGSRQNVVIVSGEPGTSFPDPEIIDIVPI